MDVWVWVCVIQQQDSTQIETSKMSILMDLPIFTEATYFTDSNHVLEHEIK